MSQNEKESKGSNIGKIITFGSLNLLLTLNLNKEEINSKKFNNLSNLEDLSFLINNKKLWDKIELSSKNELLNTLLQMNKIKKNKSVIAYLVYNKIEFNDEQNKFKDLIDSVLLDNGLVISSFDICQCKIGINLELIFNNEYNSKKKFNIYGEVDSSSDSDEQKEEDKNEDKDKENKKEESKNDENTNENKDKSEKDKNDESQEKEKEEEEEEDKNDIGIFEKIPVEEVKFEDFKYIYFHLKDYISEGEFSNEFKLNQIYNFLNKLKKDSKIKIIFNFGDEIKINQKYLVKFIKISDIHIFRNKNILLEKLNKKLKKEKEEREKKKEDLQKFIRTQKNKKSNLKKSKNSSTTNLKENNLIQNSNSGNDELKYSTKRSFNKSQSLKELPLNSYSVYYKGTLDKNNIFYFLRDLIYSSNLKENHPNYNDKLGIYLDEYKKIYLVDYKKNNFTPNITDYDLHIYPKSNVHNITEIDKIKKILEKNNDKYNCILYGCILSTLLDDIGENTNNYFMFKFNIGITISKMIILDKSNIHPPNDKSFYYIKIPKNELDKILKEENSKKKENGFNNNYYHRTYKGNNTKYYPLMDKFLTSYMQSLVNIDNLKNRNLINEKKKLLYDPEYKDFFKYGSPDKEELNEHKLVRFIMNKNLSKNIHEKEKDFKKDYMNKKPEMKFYLPGINGIPEYIVYLDKDERKKYLGNKLPPIKKKPQKEEKKEVVFDMENMNAPNVENKEEKLNEAGNKALLEEKFDTSGYKEKKFEPTQLEADNQNK